LGIFRVNFSPDFFPPLLIAASYCGRNSLGGFQQCRNEVAIARIARAGNAAAYWEVMGAY
jgi:hypothetical protein